MTPSPDTGTGHFGQPTSRAYRYQQRSRQQGADNLQARGRNVPKYELGRRDRYGDRVTRIFPSEITKSPPSRQDAPASSPRNAGFQTSSPLLSAIGSTTNTAAQYTSEWTKSLPFFANQAPPSNGISISGSPPAHHMGHGQTPLSVSPPMVGGRPLSHPDRFTSFGGRLQNSPKQSPARDRRASMFSQTGHRSPYSNPPLPHEPQPHFYGAPGPLELDLNHRNKNYVDTVPGDDGYYCGFDSLGDSGHGPSKKALNALLVGFEGGFEVLRIGKAQGTIIGRLEGLRGSVVGAKILPYTGRGDKLRSLRPLVALIIHGPVLEADSDAHNEGDAESVAVTEDDGTASPVESRAASALGQEPSTDIKEYQTTVEVYSLLKQEHVATLYKCSPVPINAPVTSPMFQRPPPSGELRLDAKGKFVTVSSGESGEVFVFSSYVKKGRTSPPDNFRCIGKFWTSVQMRDLGGGSSASSSADASNHEPETVVSRGFPIMSLSSRWIAVVPPVSSNRQSINGRALISPGNSRPPGITNTLAPAPPVETCAVEGAYGEGLADRFAREGTQAAFRGAKWAADKSMQAFRSYFGRSLSQGDADSINAGMGAMDLNAMAQFPPTHGQSPNLSPGRNESKLVTMFDLNRLLDYEDLKSKNAMVPMATFSPPNGISYMSLSPSGLMLMTVSRNGDVQYVWNLMRSHDRKPRRSAKGITGPHVRQVARFSRMTVANVVDVAWSTPKSRRLAILTEKGTVHMFPMPASAFQWPPPRDLRKSTRPAPKADDTSEANRGRAGGAITSAMSVINGTAQTVSDAVRSRSGGTNGARFPYFSSMSMTSVAGARTGKAAAMNLSRSIGTAASKFRHAQDNKIHLLSPGSVLLPNSVIWFSGQAQGRLAMVSGGVLDIYKTKMRPSRGKGKPARVYKKTGVRFPLPSIRGGPFAPAALAAINLGSKEEAAPLEGFWKLRSPPRSSAKKSSKKINPLAFAEVETCSPYLPFHMDRRVTMHHFIDPPGAEDGGVSLSQQVLDAHDNTFGNKPGRWTCISEETRLRLHLPQPEEEIFSTPVFAVHPSRPFDSGGGAHDDYYDDEGDMMIDTAVDFKKGEGGGRQIILTSTRRRRKADAGGSSDDMFEEDFEMIHFADDQV